VPSGLERRGQKSFDHFPHALGLGIGHFQIDLGEFGLAIGAQVFVAEAAHDLEVAVEAGDHQYLFEQLRRLRQGIERSRLHAAGDEIIARALGRGPCHERSFDFEESLRRKIAANRDRNFVAQFDVLLHGIAAQIDVAVLEAHFLVGENGIAGEKRRLLRFVEDAQLFRDQLDFACGDVLVERVGGALLDLANHGDHVLASQLAGLFVNGRITLLVEHDLRHAGTVADIHKDEVAQVAAAVHPSHEHGLLAGVGGAQSATAVGALQIA